MRRDEWILELSLKNGNDYAISRYSSLDLVKTVNFISVVATLVNCLVRAGA